MSEARWQSLRASHRALADVKSHDGGDDFEDPGGGGFDEAPPLGPAESLSSHEQ